MKNSSELSQGHLRTNLVPSNAGFLTCCHWRRLDCLRVLPGNGRLRVLLQSCRMGFTLCHIASISPVARRRCSPVCCCLRRPGRCWMLSSRGRSSRRLRSGCMHRPGCLRRMQACLEAGQVGGLHACGCDRMLRGSRCCFSRDSCRLGRCRKCKAPDAVVAAAGPWSRATRQRKRCRSAGPDQDAEVQQLLHCTLAGLRAGHVRAGLERVMWPPAQHVVPAWRRWQ